VGTLLVLDEVATGFGRSGRMFACEREDVAPDMLCLAKGLTGGYLPMAATLTTERIFEAFLGPPEEGRTFFHGHTYTGNALGAAAALATLEIFAREAVIEALQPKIARLTAELERLRAVPAVGDIRQCGLAAGVELVRDRAAKASFPPGERRGMKACRAARSRGVFLRPLGDTIVLMPPLSVTEAEITQLIDAVEFGIRESCP
jgi:adenosylmethionine-8-amino-7-oxononanoate aminotransferase